MRRYTSHGWVDGDTTYHYGVKVDTTKPVTGVVSNNDVEWLWDAVHAGIDLDYAAAVEEWEEENPDADDDKREAAFDCYERGTTLIGSWKQDDTGQWEPNETGEYAAIVRESVTQVVWSRHTTRAGWCSPCYPGQASIGCDGEVLAYTLPPDMMGDP